MQLPNKMLQVEQWPPGLVLQKRVLHGFAEQNRDVGRKGVGAFMTVLQVSDPTAAPHTSP